MSLRVFSNKLKLIILDRDGVINFDSPNYIRNIREWVPIPGSLEAIVKLKEIGMKIVVATNQSGIGRKFLTVQSLEAIHRKMQKVVHDSIDKIYYCPHLPEDGCYCRKPAPGMVFQALKDFDCEPKSALLIGDRQTDVEAAKLAGVKSIMLNEMRTLKTFTNELISESQTSIK